MYPAIRLGKTDTNEHLVCLALGNATLPAFSRQRRDCIIPVKTRSLTAMTIYPNHSAGHRSGLHRGESSAYYSNTARFLRLLCPLLTSATRWSPLTVRSVLLDTQQISRGKTHVFQHVNAEYTGTAYNG